MEELEPIPTMPIPVRLMDPWVQDNNIFLEELQHRRNFLEGAKKYRDELNIRAYTPCEDSPLSAVDAAVADTGIGDLLVILIQGICVHGNGNIVFSSPKRLTGVKGQELSLARTPLRLATECQLLANAENTTIADTSFWSMLMEFNKAINDHFHGASSDHSPITEAYTTLCPNGLFLKMINNPNIIAMSKTNQSTKIKPKGRNKYVDQLISDRELLARVLEPGEFLDPISLIEGTEGNFGVHNRGVTDSERAQIREIYNEEITFTYFKPHPWSKAFKIEGNRKRMADDTWLMPVLSAITRHTAIPTIVEPWPQFMADWQSKQIVTGVSKMYSRLNFSRVPFHDPSRTSL